MASIDATIAWLEKLPQDISDEGKDLVRASILNHGHWDTGKMLNSVQGTVSGNSVHIRVWSNYAAYVNDGHGPSVPKHRATWKKYNVSKLKFKESPKWPGPIYAAYASGYAGSHFFDEAAEQLRAYIRSL